MPKDCRYKFINPYTTYTWAVFSKQAGVWGSSTAKLDLILPVTLVIAISLQQTSLSLHCFDKPLRQQSNFTLHFAAIMFYSIGSKLVKKKAQSIYTVFFALHIIMFL